MNSAPGRAFAFALSAAAGSFQDCELAKNEGLATSGTNSFKYNGFGERSVATVTGDGTHVIFAEDGKLPSEHGATCALVRNYLNGVPFTLIEAAGYLGGLFD